MLLIKVCFKAISPERTVTEMKALKYRNVIFTIVLCLITSLCFPVPVSADTGENHAQELRIGVPADRCPVFYIDSNTNDVVGIGVDLMRYAAQKAGYTAAFIPIKESNLKDALDNSEYDLLMPFGSAIKSTAGTPSIATDNLMETPFTLVTVGNRKPSDTEHLRVGMLSSQKSVAETFKQLYPGMTIQMYETMPMRQRTAERRGGRAAAQLLCLELYSAEAFLFRPDAAALHHVLNGLSCRRTGHARRPYLN